MSKAHFTEIYGFAWAVAVADNKKLVLVAGVGSEEGKTKNCPLVFERIAYVFEAAIAVK